MRDSENFFGMMHLRLMYHSLLLHQLDSGGVWSPRYIGISTFSVRLRTTEETGALNTMLIDVARDSVLGPERLRPGSE